MQSSILIIEDEKDILDSLREVLDFEGYKVFCARNGQEALESLDKIPTPNLILLDMLMPKMNGKEFRKAQLRIPRLAKIPVVVMSADNTPATSFADINSSINYLKKPLDIDDLLKAVANNLGRSG